MLSFIKNSILYCIDIRRDVRNLYLARFDSYLDSSMTLYDIGCGSKPFSSVLSGKVKQHVGVDIEDGFYDSSHIDVVGTAVDVPVGDGVADAVISSQVIEHVESPDGAIKEAARILKSGGVMMFSVPFLYPIHAQPYDYSRLTEYKISKILAENDLKTVEVQKLGGFWYVLAMNIDIYMQYFNRSVIKKIKFIDFLSVVLRFLFTLFHKLEGLIFKLCKKDVDLCRAPWVANYFYVVKKT